MRKAMHGIILALFLVGCASQSVLPSPRADGKVPKTFTLVGDKFRFFMDGAENPTITVKEGDTVKIVLTSLDMPHDWVVDELNARTAKVMKGGPAVIVEFVANKKGTFEYYCSVGQHRANGMKGMIVVEQKSKKIQQIVTSKE